jgi:hypothetical protein
MRGSRQYLLPKPSYVPSVSPPAFIADHACWNVGSGAEKWESDDIAIHELRRILPKKSFQRISEW